MRLFLFTVIVSILFSCNSDLKEETIYHPNGKIHRNYFLNSESKIEGKSIEYESNGFVSAIYQFREGKPVDSIILFKKNKIESVIYLKNNDTKLVKKFEKDITNDAIKTKKYEIY